MGAAASSIPSSSSKKYDVFISFRGEDTRKTFTSHLHTALCQKDIETYIDYRLPRGEDISASLIQAIQDSTISVVVFSENYASSKWCLDELLHILHCRHYMGQIVIPVFYKVDPSHVRKQQKGSYKEAFEKHERDFIQNQDKVSKWREALLETANLAGWNSQTCRDESELIQKILDDVLQKLDLGHPSTIDGLVGIDASCECIELLLKEFQIIGIWGMGGIGKTTMAKVVFNKLFMEYDSGCFLENLREKSEKHGLTYVRDELLSELQKERGSAPNVERSAIVMNRRLRNKKVLVVLDDVNSSKQLDYLAQEFNCLGPNSRVIITTRDKHLLIGGVNEIYEAKKLNYQASLKLFNLKAFHKEHSEIGYGQLSSRAIHYAQGVPLALVVLGKFLHSKTKEEWESALKKLKKSFPEHIQEVLKLSYNGLDYEEREMFLDIACFLNGVIEGTVVDMSRHKDISLSSDTFEKMTNLRYLSIQSRVFGRSCKLNLPWGLKPFSNKLNYLRWDNYPLKCLPKFCFEKLVELHMEDSHVEKLWDGAQDIVNLRAVYLVRCKNLLELPDFSKAKKLQIMDLGGCNNLCNVHPSILSLHTLSTLNLGYCTRLESLQSEIHLECLEDLTVDGCSNMKVFSLSSKKMTRLNLLYTGFEMLPLSIERLSNLRELSFKGSTLMYLPAKELSSLSSLEDLKLYDCGAAIDEQNLQTLFDGLRSLRCLILGGCSNLSTLPDNITNLLSLSKLDLNGSSIQSLPSCIKHLPSLCSINVPDCRQLRSLPELPPSVYYINASNCVSLETVDASLFFKREVKFDKRQFIFRDCDRLDIHSRKRIRSFWSFVVPPRNISERFIGRTACIMMHNEQERLDQPNSQNK